MGSTSALSSLVVHKNDTLTGEDAPYVAQLDWRWLEEHELSVKLEELLLERHPGINRERIFSDFSTKVYHLANRAQVRNKTKKRGRADFSREFIVEIFVRQNGKCYYNETIDLLCCCTKNTEKRGHLMSLERLDPSLGYCRDNICLVALQYNTASQFSKQLLTELANGFKLPPFHSNAAAELSDRKRKDSGWGKWKREIDHEKRIAGCTACGEGMPFENFFISQAGMPASQCKKCRKEKASLRKQTDAGHHMFILATSCKASSKTRLKIHQKKCGGDADCLVCSKFGVELTAIEIAEMFDAQGGRCAISNHPMLLNAYSPFSASVDRIDDSIDYKISNYRLIATCMQGGTKTKWTRSNFIRDHAHLVKLEDDV